MNVPTKRHAGRVVLTDAEHRILLHRVHVPWQDVEVWITPGGGLDAGESYADAARRELWEETGLRVDRWDPQPAAFEDEEARFFLAQAWWRVDDIETSSDLFAPRRLAGFLDDLLRHGPPDEPVDVGI